MKYSFIVPVYGVEPYLEACVASILAQTEGDFELILVDDCSPDGCPGMCDAYARMDGRVKVIHKPVNEGLGFARNTGFQAATGEYVLFLDSDDHISPTLLEDCGQALAEGADILVFGAVFQHEDKKGQVIWEEALVPERFFADTPEKKAELFIRLSRHRIFQFAWNKLYRREFLLSWHAAFERTKQIEDFLFNIAAFSEAVRIQALDKPCYYYRRPVHDTLATQYCPDFFGLSKRKYRLEEQFLRRCSAARPEYQQWIMEGYIKHLVSAVIRNQSKAAGLPLREEIKLAEAMADDPLTRSVVAGYTPRSLQYRVICGCIRHRCAAVLVLLCYCVDFMQRKLLPVYKKMRT